MMYCTTLHLKKRTFYGGLFLVLFIGLLLQSITPLQDQEVWDETLLSWHGGGGYCSVAWA